MNPNSRTAKIWSGLSKCRNISGIPEEMCPRPQFNQEKAAELAQICHKDGIFRPKRAFRSTRKSFTHFSWWVENSLPGLVNHARFVSECKKDKETTLHFSYPVCLDTHATADHTSIASALLMHFQTAATPLSDLSAYDLAHGWVFDLHLGCATCCSWLDATVFHQRKMSSTLTVAVKAAVRHCAASARERLRAFWALTAVGLRERGIQREMWGHGHKDQGFTDLSKQGAVTDCVSMKGQCWSSSTREHATVSNSFVITLWVTKCTSELCKLII